MPSVISKHCSGYSPIFSRLANFSLCLLQVPAFTKFLAVLTEKDYTNKQKLFQISKEQFMSSLWFGQSFRSALYFTSAGSHIAVYDGNLNQGMPSEWLQSAWTHNIINQALRFVSSRALTKHLLPCIKYKLFERYLRAKLGLVLPFMFYGLWKFSLLNYQSILWSSTIPRKRGTEEKGGGGSLIHQGIQMKA